MTLKISSDPTYPLTKAYICEHFGIKESDVSKVKFDPSGLI
ncbi:MAG: hypothetical protein S4CHLAM123_05700 [Chlamydiales bacterium]|nr:hypothetical protein [Chlamydiales bacterium]